MFYGVKGNRGIFVVRVTLLNFYDKCSMTSYSPPICALLPRTSLWWGRATLFFNHMGISPSLPRGNMTAPQPLCAPLSLLWSVLNSNSLVQISLLVGTTAMRHLPYAAVAGFSMALQSISLNQYTRNKCFSHWFDALPLAHVNKYFWCLKIMTGINHSSFLSLVFWLKKKKNTAMSV